jgi:L-threonylcarbamoyladenylate synthase
MVLLKEASLTAIIEAAEKLLSGDLVAFPTETVYGLGANALEGTAVAQIFEAKERPQFNPLIIHVPELTIAQELGQFNEAAMNVAERFWPGPISLILPKTTNCPVSEICTAGLDTICLRIPSHPVAQDLLRRAEIPVAAPSANKSGEPSPTAPIHVKDSLGERISMILAAGKCSVGLESTVVDFTDEKPVILRPGAITRSDLEELLPDIDYVQTTTSKPKSPGQTLKHYAPDTPLRLNAVDVRKGEALLAFGSIRFMALEGGGSASDLPAERMCNLSESGDLQEAAANLFAHLRTLDQTSASAIAVMNIPETGIGRAIIDRLRRAAETVP